MNIWQSILDKFSKLPQWVQITTAFALLLLLIYGYISPRFINGQMVVEMENGGSVEYRGASIRTHIEGRVLKFRTNEDGYWSVPVVSRFPNQSVRLEVYLEDAQAWYDINIDYRTIWKNSLGRSDIRLVVADNPPSVKMEILARNEMLFQNVLALLPNIIGSAMAQNHVSDPPEYADTILRLKEIVGRNLEIDMENIEPSFRLKGKSAPGYTKKLLIIKDVEKSFNIAIPDEVWQTMGTIGDMADYINTIKQR